MAEEQQLTDKMSQVVKQLRVAETGHLTEVCGTLNLQIPPSKKDRHGPILKMILRYLSSEEVEDSDDGGLQLLTDVEVRLNGLGVKDEEEDTTTTGADASTSGGQNGTSSSSQASTKVEIHKIREFKIQGGTVASGENPLDFRTLEFQMNEGKHLGYSVREVMNGVIKAMKAGSSIRNYCETLGEDLTEEELKDLLKDEVKDSTTLLTQMANSYQSDSRGGAREKEKDFVLRMLELKTKIVKVSREEGYPLEEKTVRRQFLHSLAVGFKTDTIRVQVEQLLARNENIKDKDLVKEVGLIVMRNAENRFKQRSGGAGVNMLDFDSDRQSSSKTDQQQKKQTEDTNDLILAELCKISSKVEKIDVMEREISTLKGQMATVMAKSGSGGGGTGTGRRVEFKFVKCEACEATNAFCTHCSHCGETGHKRFACPKKNE
jgi:hypothetical protein